MKNKIEHLITSDQLYIAFEGLNLSGRTIEGALKNSLLSVACNYSNPEAWQNVIERLGLCKKHKYRLTKKGKRVLYILAYT